MLPRILLLITDLEIGGTPTVVREVATRLARRGRFHVEVACLGRFGPVAEQLKQQGISVTAFDAAGSADLWRVMRQLVVLIRTREIDTVFSFLIHANTVASLASLLCRDVRFFQSIQTTQPIPRWHWRLQSVVHWAAERVVVPSRSVADAAHGWADVPQEKLLVIPNAIDPAAFDFRPRREVRSIGFIGRLDPVKRIPDLLAAMTRLDDESLHLHLFGEGSERARIESEIARVRLQSRVTLHGAVARPQEALERIDLLVLPSEAEGFGLVLIEAMAAGVPVVATDVAGIRDVVENGNTGLLVPARDPQALAQAIQRLRDDPSLRDRLIRDAHDHVRAHFDWQMVLDQYERLLA